MTDNTGSTPEPQPAEPVAPAPSTETPAPSAEVTPPPAQPAEGTPAPQQIPAEPTVTAPEPPRESAQQRRARELREKAQGYSGLADRLDPHPQPAPAAPTPTPAPQQANYPDYYDQTDGTIDPVKLEAHNRRIAQEAAVEAVRQDRASQALLQERQKYVQSVESDAQKLASTVPELNPADPAYNADLDNLIEQQYRTATTNAQGEVTRTDISLEKFAMQQVEMARKLRVGSAAAVPNTTAGAAVDTAPIPGSDAPKGNKRPEDMSIAEMEQKYGITRQ